MNTNIRSTSKNRISILGLGWLGLPLALACQEKGFHIKGSTTTFAKLELLRQLDIEPYLLNVYHPETLEKYFFDADYLIINIPPGRKNPNVLKDFPTSIALVLQQIPSECRVIFVSSTSVYGTNKGIVSGDSKPIPNTDSGQALLISEGLLEQKLDSRICILRPSGLVGEKRHPAKFLAGRKGLKEGEAPVNLIHQKDVIQVILAVIDKGVWGEVFNLSMDGHPSKREYYSWAAQHLGLAVPEYESGGEDGKIISNTKMKNRLGVKLKYANPRDWLPTQ